MDNLAGAVFKTHMLLLTATNAFRLGTRCYSSLLWYYHLHHSLELNTANEILLLKTWNEKNIQMQII